MNVPTLKVNNCGKTNVILKCFLFRWFHGKISREMAEDLLTPKENGLFLVRESTNYPGDYTLCVCYLGKVEHYRVKYKDNQLTIDDEEFFENLSQLVEVSISYVNYTHKYIEIYSMFTTVYNSGVRLGQARLASLARSEKTKKKPI